jgi:hypothetical protein
LVRHPEPLVSEGCAMSPTDPDKALFEVFQRTYEQWMADPEGTLLTLNQIDLDSEAARAHHGEILAKGLGAPADAIRHQQPWNALTRILDRLPFSGRVDQYDEHDEHFPADRLLKRAFLNEIKLICAQQSDPVKVGCEVRGVIVAAHWFFGQSHQAWLLTEALRALDWFKDTRGCFCPIGGHLVDPETPALRRFLARRSYER